MERRLSKTVKIGSVSMGGENPIVVQSMTNTDPANLSETVKQVKELESLGCELIRVAVPHEEGAINASLLRERVGIPVVADIHFHYELALKVLNLGIDGLRINPGNIGSKERVQEIALLAREKRVPIRVGVNAGSLHRDLLKKYQHPTPLAMVESALEQIRVLEETGFDEIILSLKASNVPMTIKANHLLAEEVDYPLHLGITEAGSLRRGTIHSSVGLGILLYQGIGDTIRVSLTAPPREEVKVAWEILRSLGLRVRGPTVISCPTCGRTKINLISLVEEVEESVKEIDKPLTIAVMGCEVNGPGEAREADIGIAGGRDGGLLFKRGEVLGRVERGRLLEALLEEIQDL